MRNSGPTLRISIPAAALCLLWLSPGCQRPPPSPSADVRTLVENARIANASPPGGFTLNVELEPGRDYVFELRGQLDRGIPTLRVDRGGAAPADMRYLAVSPPGLRFRVHSSGRLRLMIYQDEPFSYRIESLRLRTAEADDSAIADIFDASLPSDRYTLPPPR